MSQIDGGTGSKAPTRAISCSGIWVYNYNLYIIKNTIDKHVWGMAKPMRSAEDVVATAPTGSGKTLAFLVPAMVPWVGKEGEDA